MSTSRIAAAAVRNQRAERADRYRIAVRPHDPKKSHSRRHGDDCDLLRSVM